MLKLLQQEWRLLFFGFLMSFFSLPGQTVVISLFSGHIRNEFSLSHGDFGLLYSIATLCSSILLVKTGALTDSVPLRRLALYIIIGLAGACFMMGLVSHIWLLLVVLILLRQFGQGLMTLCGITAVVRYLAGHKGKAASFVHMGYSVAEACVPLVTTLLIITIGWHNTWLFFGGILLLIMLPVTYWLLNTHKTRHQNYQQAIQEQTSEHTHQWNRRQVLGDSTFYFVIPALTLHAFVFTGLFFHQVHLAEHKDWVLTEWVSLFAIYASSSIASLLVSGFLIDRWGAFRLLFIPGIFMSMGLFILVWVKVVYWSAFALLLMGIAGGMLVAIGATFWVEVYGTKYLGSIKSMSTALMVFSSAASPVLLGELLDMGISIITQIQWMAVTCLLVSLLALVGYVQYRYR